MAVLFTPPTPTGPPGRGLTTTLISLAGTPDDESAVPALLRSINQLAADLLPPVSYASITTREKDGYATVAMSSEVARAVDEAQYVEREGPCLDALRTSSPTALDRIDATVPWPRFREVAQRFGLRASLSIPLFAGRGTPIAALNLYGRDAATMTPLSAVVVEAYRQARTSTVPGRHDLAPGVAQLLDGLAGAFGIRDTIQQALGVIMAVDRRDADSAYAVLRSRAAQHATTLIAVARSVVAGRSTRRGRTES